MILSDDYTPDYARCDCGHEWCPDRDGTDHCPQCWARCQCCEELFPRETMRGSLCEPCHRDVMADLQAYTAMQVAAHLGEMLTRLKDAS